MVVVAIDRVLLLRCRCATKLVPLALHIGLSSVPAALLADSCSLNGYWFLLALRGRSLGVVTLTVLLHFYNLRRVNSIAV